MGGWRRVARGGGGGGVSCVSLSRPVSPLPEPALSHLLALSALCHSNGVREREPREEKYRGETPVSPHCVLTATRAMPGMHTVH